MESVIEGKGNYGEATKVVAVFSPYWCHVVPAYSPDHLMLRREPEVLEIALQVRPIPVALSRTVRTTGIAYILLNLLGIFYDTYFLWKVDGKHRCFSHIEAQGLVWFGELTINLVGYLCVTSFWICICAMALRTIENPRDYWRYLVHVLPRNRRLSVGLALMVLTFVGRLIALGFQADRYGLVIAAFLYACLAPAAVASLDLLVLRGQPEVRRHIYAASLSFMLVSVRIALTLPFDCALGAGTNNIPSRAASNSFITCFSLVVTESMIAVAHHIRDQRWWVPSLYQYRRLKVTSNHLAETGIHATNPACCAPLRQATQHDNTRGWNEEDLESSDTGLRNQGSHGGTDSGGLTLLGDIELQEKSRSKHESDDHCNARCTVDNDHGGGSVVPGDDSDPAPHLVMYCSPNYCHVIARAHKHVRRALEQDPSNSCILNVYLQPLGWRLPAFVILSWTWLLHSLFAISTDLFLVYPATYIPEESCLVVSRFTSSSPLRQYLPVSVFGAGCVVVASAVMLHTSIARATLTCYRDIRRFHYYGLRNNARLIMVAVAIIVLSITTYIFGGAISTTSEFRIADAIFGVLFGLGLLSLAVVDVTFIRASRQIQKHSRPLVLACLVFALHVYIEYQISCRDLESDDTISPGDVSIAFFRTIVGFAALELTTFLVGHLRPSEWWSPSSIRFHSAAATSNYLLPKR